MVRALILSLLAGVMIISCTPQNKKEEVTEWKTVGFANFTVKLPSFLKEVKDLHEDAVLQYQNPLKEFYFIVIRENASAFHQALEDGELTNDYPANLEGYANLIGDKFSENVDEVLTKSALKTVPLKGMEGKYFEANAKVDGIGIHYHYGFVKGDSTYYQVLSWTLDSKEKKFSDIMFDILRSFKEK